VEERITILGFRLTMPQKRNAGDKGKTESDINE